MSKKLNKNVPKLRLSEFINDWEKKPLQEISVNGFSNGVFNDPQKVGSGYRLVNVKDMYSGESINVNSLTKLELDEKEFLKNQAKYGDIFFTRSSLVKEGIAQSNVLLDKAEDITYDGHLIKFSANRTSYLPEFIALVLRSDTSRRQFVARGKTGTMTTIGQDDVATVKIFCPSIAEQEKIASFLGAIATRLTQLRRKHELLQTYKRGVMQKIFSQEVRFKGAIGGAFPDWEEKKLGNVAKFSKGKGLSKDDLAEFGSLKCIRYAELYTLYDEVIDHVFSSTNLDLNDLVLSIENDVIIPASGESAIEIAKASCVKISGVALGGDLNIIKSSINGEFLAHYLNHYKKNDIARVAQGNTVVHLYSSQLAKIEIEIPAKEEQQKIVDFLTAIDRKIEAVARQSDRTEQFKKGLLQKMFV